MINKSNNKSTYFTIIISFFNKIMKAFKYLIKKSFKLTFYLLITKPSLIFKYLKWILRGGYFIFGSSFLLAFNIFGLQEYTSYISLLLKNLGINNIFRSINARLIDTYE